MRANTILNQKKFTPKDVQAVAARLSKLSKYTEGAIPQSSILVRKMYSTYKKGIEKGLPELGKLRKNYAVEKKMYDELANLMGEGKWKPTSVTSAIKRLSNVFREDNETYLRILQNPLFF